MENVQPKLRFPEFKDDWKKTALKNIGTVITGTTPSTSNGEYYNGNNLFLSPADINNNRFVYNTKTKLTDLGFSKTRRLKPNSIAFVCIGSTIGKIAQVKKEFATNQQINSIEVFENFSEDFGYYSLLKSSSKIKTMASVQTVPQINKSDFSKINISLPSLPEQTKIADFLGAMDKQLELLTTKKEKLQLYKKGVMQKLFSQEIRFTKEDGTNYPDWEEKTLGELFKIQAGKDYKHLNSGNIPVYGTGGVMLQVDNFLFDGKSVCIGRKGTIDKPMLLNGKFWTVDTLFYTKDFKGCIPEYIYQLFLNIKWRSYNEASGVPSLSTKIIKNIEVSVPSLEEQTKIADFLTAIDNQIEAINNQITKTENYKKGLLQQMFV